MLIVVTRRLPYSWRLHVWMKQDPAEKTLPLPELKSELEPSRKVPSGKFPQPTLHLGVRGGTEQN